MHTCGKNCAGCQSTEPKGKTRRGTKGKGRPAFKKPGLQNQSGGRTQHGRKGGENTQEHAQGDEEPPCGGAKPSQNNQQPPAKKKPRVSTHEHGQRTARATRARLSRHKDGLQDSAFTVQGRQHFSDDSLVDMPPEERGGHGSCQTVAVAHPVKRKVEEAFGSRKQQAIRARATT